MKRGTGLCAHRGYSAAAPESTLPAFEMALRAGVEEIELDIWPARDGTLFVCHDRTVDRTTDGFGAISSLTADDIARLDAGSWFSPDFAGVRIPTFDQVLSLVSNQAVVNVHVKSPAAMEEKSERVRARRAEYSRLYRQRVRKFSLDDAFETYGEAENRTVIPYDERCFAAILSAVDRHHARGHVYVTGEKDVLLTAAKLAPDLPRCCLEGDSNYTLVAHALALGCRRVQFCKHYLTRAMIGEAKAHGIHCNLFWSDDAEEAAFYRSAGIDTLLTNDPKALITAP